MKISENVSAKYYQENKEGLPKKANEIYQNLSEEKKRKKVTICSWMLQKPLRRLKAKARWVYKKYYRMRKNVLS